MRNGDCGARRGDGRPGTMLAGAALVLSAAVLSGCGSPTYGTGVTAEQQLVEDVTGVLSLAPKQRPPIDYSPRPELVKPPSMEVLPPPQESVASTENPAWPESPEERLARVRAEATANQDNPFYRSDVIRDIPSTQKPRVSEDPNHGVIGPSSPEERAEIARRRQIAIQGSPTTRRYLSDPPIDYRQPASTAPTDELGEDEWKKQRAARRAAGGGGGLRRLIPWLD